MITNEIYFFENQSSVSTSDFLYNVNDGTLILQVDGDVSNLELSVLGNTDLVDDDFVTLKTINASDYSMGDKITSIGIYWIDINGIRKIKLNLSKITGSVNVKALTKRGLTTDLVARAMAANSQSGGCSLEEVKAITGALTDLSTEDKSNIVNAINEVAGNIPKDIPVYSLVDNEVSYNDNEFYYRSGVLSQISEILNNNFGKFVLIAIRGSSASSTSNSNCFVFFICLDKPTTTNSNLSKTILGYEFATTNTSRPLAIKEFSMTYNTLSTGTVKVVTLRSLATYRRKYVTFTSDVLTKTNTTEFIPTDNYHPSTKKYVDDAIASAITTSLEASY